ncbi:MAG: FtsX-like permease family protein [Bryobacteraceae bacterium]
MAAPRFQTMLLGSFAPAGLLLAALGVYGVIACNVARRTYEFGIRMALGATRGSILRLILSAAGMMIAAGLGIGLFGAVAAGRLLTSLLYGVRATDALTFGAAVLVVAAVALLACVMAGRRATRVDPAAALRYE